MARTSGGASAYSIGLKVATPSLWCRGLSAVVKLEGMRISIGIALVGACFCAQAQWHNQPMAGAPRNPDGTINMTGPAPRLNGKPDLSGIWQVQAEPRGPGL